MNMNLNEAKEILNKNGFVLKERFENIDEIRVPEWLWVAYETGDTSNLEDEEIVILHIFEKDHKKHHLEANEEPNFYRTNDVTDEGGMCYTVQVFEDRMDEDYNFYRNPFNQMNRKRQKQSVIKKELNKWFNLLSQMDKVKTHHYEIKGNTIIEYTKSGIDAVWTFEMNKNDINVVVSWINRPEWQEMKPVEFEYTLDEYDDYENDVKEFLTCTGKFH